VSHLPSYDVHAVRAQFPALKAGAAHFDGAGGTQIPQPVIDAMVDAMSGPLANRGSHTSGERNADRIVVRARRAMADLLGADPGGIVFGRSSTQVVYDYARTLAKTWRPGDEIVVTRLDHECNVRPWVQAAARVGARVRWADFDPASGELTVEHVRAVLSERTRLVAVTAASNLIGTRPPVAEIAREAHLVGALMHVDAAQYTAHVGVDMAALGADSLSCSAYKFLGPHLGVLAARPDLLHSLEPDKLLAATDAVPERFELGILPYSVLAGVAATVDFIAGLCAPDRADRRMRLAASMAALEEYEDDLRRRIERDLAAVGGVTVHSRAALRTPTVLLSFEDRDPAQVYRHLAERGVDTGVGTFYSVDASHRLGLGDQGGVRVALAPYSTDEEADRLLNGIEECLRHSARH